MERSLFSLDGKVAIVTGGKKGIGRAIALALAEAGADVAVCGRTLTDGQLENAAADIRKLGRRSLSVKADITIRDDVEKLVERVVKEFGRIDILVNNAGMLLRSPFLELSEADWDKVIDTDLKGYYFCCQVVGRRMVAQSGGNIINIASGLGSKPLAGTGVYSIAKAGVLMMTRVLAIELAQYHIRVNAISPAMVKTDMSSYALLTPEAIKQAAASRPLGRIAEPEDIVGAAVFLASDASGYITGHNILVDGGLYA
ncbi:MAG: 3-oxoacyl-ACP reductase FabG [Chloroflexi bacterium]|nr:3-oxoacyl-ACP reductase FabG [Chloroflexota bacterium]